MSVQYGKVSTIPLFNTEKCPQYISSIRKRLHAKSLFLLDVVIYYYYFFIMFQNHFFCGHYTVVLRMKYLKYIGNMKDIHSLSTIVITSVVYFKLYMCSILLIYLSYTYSIHMVYLWFTHVAYFCYINVTGTCT